MDGTSLSDEKNAGEQVADGGAAANFKEQVKSLLAQRVENYKSDVESLTGTAPLELADNGDHFSYPGVIDGERDELPL